MLKRMISILLALVICVTSFSGVQLNAMATGETDVSALAEPTDPPEYVPALPTEAQPETEPVEMPEEWIPPATAPALPTEPATEPTEAPAPTETPGTGEDPSEIVDSVEWTVPNKTKYIVNQEELDTTGCTVLFTYQDGHQEQYDITPDMVRGFDNTVLGHQKLVVTCKDYKFSFSVTIIEEPKPAHFNFNSWAVKTGYLLGEELDLTGGELRVFYDNNSIEIVPVTDSNVTVSGYNPELLGQQAITISYMELTREFYVTVSAPTGKCGDNLYFAFDNSTGRLTITGTGAMYDYEWDMPWRGYSERILKVELSDGLTTLGKGAFTCCGNLKSIDLPDTLTTISDHALEECFSLTDLTIPGSVKYIGVYALSGTRLTELVLPEGLETIDMYAFMSCYTLKNVVLPESLKHLGGGAFQYCTGLEEAQLPETLETVPWHTFIDCTSLKEIVIPKTVTEISYYAFAGCTSLEDVTFEGSAPYVDAGLFGDAYPFNYVTADAWYPGEDTTWTEEARMRLGAELNWMPYGAVENRLILDSTVYNGLESVCIDGMEYDIQKDGSFWYIDLPDGNARVMTAYEYHVDDPSDAQTRYPISMKVWTLKNDGGIYTATRQEAFDNIFQYSGVSIRVTGKKGIRMITSVEDGKKTALTGAGLAGYTLKEYGTAVAWSSHLRNDKPLVLGKAWTKSSYAYKQGVADLVFRQMDGFFLYTNVLVNFSNEQCRNLIAMRPSMILQDPEGEEITLYGGVVERSIGYIALMNRTAFMPDTDAYEFIWDIIHYVYGDSYDQDYIPSWTKPVM